MSDAEEFADAVVRRLEDGGVTYDFWSIGNTEPMTPRELLIRGFEAGIAYMTHDEG